MRTTIWRAGVAISAATLLLAACGDTDENGAGGDDNGEVSSDTTDGETSGETTDDDADEGTEPAANAAALSPEQITGLLLEESEFPVEFDSFTNHSDTLDAIAESVGAESEMSDYAGAMGMNTGMWTDLSAEMPESSLLQVGITSYESLPGELDLDDLDLEALEELGLGDSDLDLDGLEDLGDLGDLETDYSYEEISHNGWEGVTTRVVTEIAGSEHVTESATLSRLDGNTVLMVSASGEGQQYLEQIADLQWEKYQEGV